MSYVLTIPKIDNEAVLGLAGTYNSLAYRVHEIERHFHNTPQHYGSDGSGSMTLDGLTEWQIACASGAWGTELQIHDGTVIESGSATKKFDLHEMYVTACNTANRPMLIEFLSNTLAAGVAITSVTNATETFTKVGHGLASDDKVLLRNSGGGLPTGTNAYTVYYAVKVDDDNFTLSRQAANADPVLITTDGTGTHSFYKLTQTRMSTKPLSFSSTTSDATEIQLMAARVTCNTVVTCRGKADGGTNTVDFLLGLHTYTA